MKTKRDPWRRAFPCYTFQPESKYLTSVRSFTPSLILYVISRETLCNERGAHTLGMSFHYCTRLALNRCAANVNPKFYSVPSIMNLSHRILPAAAWIGSAGGARPKPARWQRLGLSAVRSADRTRRVPRENAQIKPFYTRRLLQPRPEREQLTAIGVGVPSHNASFLPWAETDTHAKGYD